MVGIIDGLGGEEIGQAGSQISKIWVTGSIVTESNLYVGGSIVVNSGLTTFKAISGLDTFMGGSVVGNKISDAGGRIVSTNFGSPTAYSYRVQAGFVATSAGSTGNINLGASFGGQPYAVTFGTSGATASAALPAVSGLQTVSGCTIIGDASTVYSWIAVGKAA